jgi:hypothetical protein
MLTKVAHSLSQMAVSQIGDFIWLEAIPQCIHSLVLALYFSISMKELFIQKEKK